MGTELTPTPAGTPHTALLSIPWLDPKTTSSVADIIQSVALHHPEVQAIILFGSVARHEERPLNDAQQVMSISYWY